MTNDETVKHLEELRDRCKRLKYSSGKFEYYDEAEQALDMAISHLSAYPPAHIDPETLPIVKRLRAELARVTAERDAAVKDLKRCAADLKDCAVENYMECNYCKNELEKYVSEICRNCKDGSNFEWRGPRKED